MRRMTQRSSRIAASALVLAGFSLLAWRTGHAQLLSASSAAAEMRPPDAVWVAAAERAAAADVAADAMPPGTATPASPAAAEPSPAARVVVTPATPTATVAVVPPTQRSPAAAAVTARAAGPVPGGAPAARAVDNTTRTLDTGGQPMDAHDGDLLQVGGTTYLYGTAYGCGFTLGAPGPYCGVRVYSSTDLATWSPAGAVGGFAFDHGSPDWQARCTAPSLGCFRPHVVRRPSDGAFVMWLSTHSGAGPDKAGYRVLVSADPGGPFVDSGVTPRLAVDPGDGGLEHGDEDVTVAGDRGYVVYTVIDRASNAHRLVAERLDATLTTGTGRYVEVTAAGRSVEAPSLFFDPRGAGTWRLAYSDPAVPYGVARTSVVDAPDPLGPWTGGALLQADSCSGQPAAVVDLGDVTVYMSDRWVQPATGPNTGVVANQSEATLYLGRLALDTVDASGAPVVGEHRCQAQWVRSD